MVLVGRRVHIIPISNHSAERSSLPLRFLLLEMSPDTRIHAFVIHGSAKCYLAQRRVVPATGIWHNIRPGIRWSPPHCQLAVAFYS